MTEPFSKTFHARWGDMDFNAHMGNTAYLDACVDVRLMFFQEHGFPVRELERLRIGPVVLRDELDYFRELRLLDPVKITLRLAGLSADASRFRLRNEFFREDGALAARVSTLGGWLDLTKRKLTVPPEELAAALRLLQRTEDFQELPASAPPGDKSPG
ncbi:MAG TPA: thioesterase family protein [Thermoanaerobaculia bacterium]|jgi:acyl-CoA thioester hydrolase|nr:thioesterase family protein [Thermoanaerobaculia bacterium]